MINDKNNIFTLLFFFSQRTLRERTIPSGAKHLWREAIQKRLATKQFQSWTPNFIPRRLQVFHPKLGAHGRKWERRVSRLPGWCSSWGQRGVMQTHQSSNSAVAKKKLIFYFILIIPLQVQTGCWERLPTNWIGGFCPTSFRAIRGFMVSLCSIYWTRSQRWERKDFYLFIKKIVVDS